MPETLKNKVLIIDDSAMARKLLMDQLASDRFEVYEAKDGPTGLSLAVEINPDLILLDYVMPKMNGYEVFQALREQPQFSETPVIIVSSSYDEVVKKFGLPFIGFEFLHKQSTQEQLEARINAVFPVVAEPLAEVLAVAPPSPAPQLPTVAPVPTAPEPTTVQVTRTLAEDFQVIITRLEQLESHLLSNLDKLQKPVTQISELVDRMTMLEQRMAEIAADPSPEVLERIAALEQRFLDFAAARPLSSAPELSTPDRSPEVLERIAALEQRLIPLARLEAIAQRLDQLKPGTANFSLDPVLTRLDRLESQLSSTPSAKPSLAPLPLLIVAAAVAAAVGGFVGTALQPKPQSQTSQATVLIAGPVASHSLS